jgi:predicted nucleic acid-binding protein
MELMPSNYLLDTSLFVDHLRGIPVATQLLLQLQPLTSEYTIAYSILSELELFAGVITSRHEQETIKALSPFKRVPLTVTIARNAGIQQARLVRNVPRGTSLPGTTDTAIAMTAILHDFVLISENRRHFSLLPVLLYTYIR